MKTDRFLLTDQISCFDENGIEINCLNSGQDGAFGSIQPETLNRFNIIGKIVQDQWTGLVWPINANLADFPLTWKESFEFVKEMNHSKRFDRSDWKMPTRKELFSLISHQQINPSLPKKHPFNNFFNGYYWTGTECARLPNQAWYIHMGGARVYRGMKHGSYMVCHSLDRLSQGTLEKKIPYDHIILSLTDSAKISVIVRLIKLPPIWMPAPSTAAVSMAASSFTTSGAPARPTCWPPGSTGTIGI